MFLKELSLNKFLFLHVARFIICNENLIKWAANQISPIVILSVTLTDAFIV